MIDLKQEALKEQAYLTALRREFHQHPELGLHEFRTANRIEEELDHFGISHTRVGETGILGILKGEKGAGSIVALRADIDALPIQETHETDYSSTVPGVIGRHNAMNALAACASPQNSKSYLAQSMQSRSPSRTTHSSSTRKTFSI